MQTVREQLVEALEGLTEAASGAPLVKPELLMARLALDRARAEPKTHHREDLLVALDELFDGSRFHVGWDEWNVAEKAFRAAQSELSCPDICDTSCRCYQDGLEAQREPECSGCKKKDAQISILMDGHCDCGDDDCPTWAHGYQAGLEAQRERVG